MKRCSWVGINKPHYEQYHDNEWGVPVHDDRLLFEMLILEGAQAGLSWETILKRRDGYRKAFYNFDVQRVAAMNDGELEAQLQNPEIIRNRLKVFSARQNAQAFLEIQREFGSFDTYVWGFVNHRPVRNPGAATSLESDALSKDLKRRNMKFVGSTIIYAFMQAIGMANDHEEGCIKWAAKVSNLL